MGLYNFQSRFVPFILSGAKQHTIRATRKNQDKPDNICHLYTGLRVKGKTRLLGRFPCTGVETIKIVVGCKCGQAECQTPYLLIKVGTVWLSPDEGEKLARLDGFKDLAEMATFWKGRLPFEGHITHWRWEKQ